jgi:hypothetical protein
MARWWAVVVALIGVGFLLYPGSAPYLRWYVLAPISILGFPQATGEFVRRGTPEAPPLHWLEPCQARYPGDLAVQVGCFLFATPNPFGEQEVALEKLDALQRQFPQEPALYLMQIRYRIGNFNFVRAESLTRMGANPPPPRNPDPQLARQLLRLATEGERIDPQNGFFPAIRALVLYALERDDEALRALERAGNCPRWETYEAFFANALVATYERCLGWRGAYPASTFYTVLIFPEMAQMREMARTVAGLALQAEQRGHLRQGVRLRMALARLGALMRAESPTLIGSLVGIAITSIAGGSFQQNWQIPKPPPPDPAKWRQERFLNALMRNGFQREAQWFRKEFERMKQAKAISAKASDWLDTRILAPFAWLIAWHMLGMLLQGILLSMGVMWVWALLAARRLEGKWWLAPLFGVGVALLWALSPAGTLVVSFGESLRGFAMFTDSAQVEAILQRLPEELTALRWLSFGGVAFVAVALPAVLALIVWLLKPHAEPETSRSVARMWGRIALFWLTLYVATLAWLWYRDRGLEQAMLQSFSHEIRFYTQLSGEAWPGRE